MRGLRVEDYDREVLHVRRSVWRTYVEEPEGKNGRGAIPVIVPRKRHLERMWRGHIPRCIDSAIMEAMVRRRSITLHES